jgi:hypothetical protein
MGARLKKIVFFVFMSVFLLESCSGYKQIRNDKQQVIFAYKASICDACLKASGVIIAKDASPSLNFQLIGDFNFLRLADSIGLYQAKLIKERAGWFKGGEMEEHSAILNGCLELYDSKYVDSLARDYAKKWVENQKKYK